MNNWNIAIVGAQGQIGSALVQALEKSDLLIAQFDPIGYETDSESIRFQGKNRTVLSIEAIEDWSVYHLVFLTVSESVAQQYAPQIAGSGAVVIDASGAFSQNLNIPLVLPHVNSELLAEHRNENIIALPHPIILQLVETLSALTDLDQLQQVNLTNLIPVSLFGKKGVEELASQSARLLNGLPVENQLFDQQLAFNLLPNFQHDLLNEEALILQFQRLIGQDQIGLNIENIVTPVFYGLTQSVSFLNPSMAGVMGIDRSQFETKGIQFAPNEESPTPVGLTHHEEERSDKIHLTRLRENPFQPDYIQYISVSDNIHTLGAKAMCDIAVTLLAHYY